MSDRLSELRAENERLYATIRRLEALKNPIVTIDGLPDGLEVVKITFWPYRPEVHIKLGHKDEPQT